MRQRMSPAPEMIRTSRTETEKERLDQATVLIVSDNADFSRAIPGRWQSERDTPTFTLMSGDLCQELDEDAFDVTVVGGLRPGSLSGVLEALDPAKAIIVICEDVRSLRELREFRPEVMALQKNEGWLDALVLIVSEALRRSQAVIRLRRSENAGALLQQQAALGNYMREMLHNLNNALTSVLGNSELLLLEPESLTLTAQSQVETIRNMALRMHEILHRFSSLEKELKVVATQTENETHSKARSAAAR